MSNKNDDSDAKKIEIRLPYEKLITDALSPSIKTIGLALNGITTQLFKPLLKMNIYNQADLDDFSSKIEHKLNQIPDNNKDDTKLGLLLKSFTESQYQLNDEMLREMFANLISSTVDSTKNNLISPRYPLILSQLNHKNAIFLNTIAHNQFAIFPCFQISKRDKDNTGGTMISPIYIGLNFDINNLLTDNSSIDVLSSLGIIKHSDDGYSSSPLGKEFYKDAESTLLFKKATSSYSSSDDVISIQKEYMQFTDFGKEFIKIICKVIPA